MHENIDETQDLGPFPADATDRRKFLLRLAKASAFAVPMVYSVSVGALPAAAMSGAGKSGNCPPGQFWNFGRCTPTGQLSTGTNKNDFESATWGEKPNVDPVWKAPEPNLPDMVEPGSGGVPRGLRGVGSSAGGRRDGGNMPDLLAPEPR